jgi:hypothetical protein
MASSTLAAGMVADGRLGGSIADHHHIDPAEALDQHLGPIDTPPLVQFGGFGFALRGRACGFEPQVRLDQELRRPHQPQNALLVDRELLDAVQVGPDATGAPERMLRLQLPNPLPQSCVTLGHHGRLLSAHPSTSSLLLHSKVSSPTRVFSLGFGRARRASRWRCSWTSKAFGAWAINWSRH